MQFRRKTCEGLSAWLFFFAVMGNLTYGISIIIFPGKLAGSIPWIVGSLGTLCFDFTVCVVAVPLWNGEGVKGKTCTLIYYC